MPSSSYDRAGRGKCRADSATVQFQRRLAHRAELFLQLDDDLFPMPRRGKPGKGSRESRIVPAPSNPRVVMQDADRAQCLDQVQLTAIERMEQFVALQQPAELLSAR